ncbi:DNA primase [Anaerotalea alkaliphila]|uniref:DNA primase n=1 Tax=Anaerotalea alkaliphila TaxID=2662126 RepID=A0A7X5HT41_9FIRM|nr:DNA primase [Anaerotalea alkaliphila]NDL66177.1 DNA primase [Anaerotalea alkaliphila]
MYFPDEIIEEVRVRNDIVDVISQYVKLTPKGSSHFGLCPFHHEKTPSFSVSKDKQMYYCFGCGAGGNVYTFLMAYENYSFVEAVKSLADRVHLELPEPEVSEEMKKEIGYKQQLYEANRLAARYFYYQLTQGQGKTALAYLENRKIGEEYRKKFGLGYANFYRDDLLQFMQSKGIPIQVLLDAGLAMEDKGKKGSHYDRFFNRLMFPILDVQNRIVGFGGRVLGDGGPKYLNSPETKIFDKSRNLYGMNLARTSRGGSILLVEGYLDVISLHQAGYGNAVASLGTALTKGQAALIKRYSDEVVIAYDTDEAGIQAALRAFPVLKEAGLSVRVATMEGAKDPDELIQARGPEAFGEVLGKALPGFMFEVRTMAARTDLEDPAYKTQFTREVARKILMMEDGHERDNYIAAVAKEYGIREHTLGSLVNELGNQGGLVRPEPPSRARKKPMDGENEDALVKAQKNLLSFMVNHEKLFAVIKEHVSPFHFTDALLHQVAVTVYGLDGEGLEIVPSAVIDKFMKLEDQTRVAGVFNNPIPIENQIQLEKMINESIRLLKGAYLDNLARNLADPQALMEAIQEKRMLQNFHLSLRDL